MTKHNISNFTVAAITAVMLLIGNQMKAGSIGVSSPFRNWDNLIEYTRHILIVQCTKTRDEKMLMGGGPTDIRVVYILKGSTNSNPIVTQADQLGLAKLQSEYIPTQGEYYLIFANFHEENVYQATEPYRVVPLGLWFYTDDMSGKSLDEQVQLLFKRRIGDLKREIKDDQAEEARLEERVKP